MDTVSLRQGKPSHVSCILLANSVSCSRRDFQIASTLAPFAVNGLEGCVPPRPQGTDDQTTNEHP